MFFKKNIISIYTVNKLFTDNMILLLIFTQQAQHKIGCNTMHAQIFSENLMPHGFWNSNFFCYFTNGQMTIGTNRFSIFLDVFFIFWCWRLSWLFTVLDVTTAFIRMLVPLMGLCSTQSFVHQTLILTFWKSLKKVSLIWNKISHKHILHDNHPFLIAEKFA